MRKRILVDEPYHPSKGDRVCLRGDPEESGGTVVTVGAEQSEVKWDWINAGGFVPHRSLKLKPLRKRKQIKA